MKIRYKKYLIVVSFKGIKVIKNTTAKLVDDLRKLQGKYMKHCQEKYGSEAYEEYLKNKTTKP